MTIDEAVVHFKGQAPLAKRLGVRQPAISMWKKRGGTIPLAVQWQIRLGLIEEAAKGDKALADKIKAILKADEPAFLD